MAGETEREAARRVIAENRKARHDYHVFETYESGVALLSTAVKAIRKGRVNLRDSFARVERGEVWMLNAGQRRAGARQARDDPPTRGGARGARGRQGAAAVSGVRSVAIFSRASSR